jgi:hypothetical protein
LFGVLRTKLALITRAYFNERNFAKVEVLADLYAHLCDTLTDDAVTMDERALFGVRCALVRCH